MVIANIVALSIMLVGCFNWLVVGVFSWNFVTWICGTGVIARIIYAIVGLAAIWMLIQLCIRQSRLFTKDETTTSKK